MERHVVASFLYPFRGRGRAVRWLVGVLLVALLPVAFPIVFGYAVACVRSAACDPEEGPPAWRADRRLVADGCWTALQAIVLSAPFAAAAWLLAPLLAEVFRPAGVGFVDAALGWIAAVTICALPWGVLVLVVVPPTLALFAVTGRPADLAGLRWVVACVRERYAQWNLVLVAVTTSWALAAVGLALVGVGVVVGAFYAILVSAHACAALAPDRTPR
ncbi:MAG TPA: DUF4013 domain-containing protein [Candidatus Dormibacteraeota bacterium]|nr:DUF4013 domain-containing protein [Candidatus Dormibacteraeota bacterium]